MWTNCSRPAPLTTNNPYKGGMTVGHGTKRDVFPKLVYIPKRIMALPLSALSRGTSHNKHNHQGKVTQGLRTLVFQNVNHSEGKPKQGCNFHFCSAIARPSGSALFEQIHQREKSKMSGPTQAVLFHNMVEPETPKYETFLSETEKKCLKSNLNKQAKKLPVDHSKCLNHCEAQGPTLINKHDCGQDKLSPWWPSTCFFSSHIYQNRKGVTQHTAWCIVPGGKQCRVEKAETIFL